MSDGESPRPSIGWVAASATQVRRLPIRTRLLGGFLAVLSCLGLVVALILHDVAEFRRALEILESVQARQKAMRERIAHAYEELDKVAMSLLVDPADRSAVERSQLVRPELVTGLNVVKGLIETTMTQEGAEFRRTVDNALVNLTLYNERLFNVVDALESSRSVDTFLAYQAVADQATVQLNALASALDSVFTASILALKERVRRELGVAFAVFGSALLIGGVLGVTISRSLVDPITALSRAAKAVAAGHLDEAFPSEPGDGATDEVGDLARSFTTMTRALRRQVRELHDLNASLETRVAERTAELAQRNEELDTFTYSVSHDLKSPVVALQGLVGIILEDYGDRFDDQGRRYLDRLVANTTHMDHLIQDLLALSHIGRAAARYESVPVHELLEDVLALHAETIATRGIRVELGSLPVLVADRVHLQQVFQNLLSNAIKFLGDQSAPRIVVSCEEGDEFARFEVRDNGIGIDPAYHDKIFVIFQRLQEIEVEGTGVGLAIVKKIVEQAGGRLTLRSSKNQGAAFAFTWPRRPAAYAEAA
jgi:signal transduction histidine kinase